MPTKLQLVTKYPLGDLADALDTEIQVAWALNLAIHGDTSISGSDGEPLMVLSRVHAERLEAIKDQLEAIRGRKDMAAA